MQDSRRSVDTRPMTVWGRLLVAVMGCAAMLAVVPPAAPAHAQDSLAEYGATVEIAPDGALHVTASLVPGPATPEEITQTMVLRQELVRLREYRYEVTDVTVTSGGQPAGEVSDSGSDELTVAMRPAGREPVELSYTVRGAATTDEAGLTAVEWPVLQGLSVGVEQFHADVAAPGMFRDFKCFAGAPGTQNSCQAAEGFPQETSLPTFRDGPRAAGEVVGLRMVFDPQTVAPDASVAEKWSLARAFTATGWPLGVALAVLVIGGFGLWLLHRRGGKDARPDGMERIAEFRPAGEGVSEFVVLTSVRPGQVGTLVDERVDPVDVTASILDLAVRGYLRIHELPRQRNFAGGDWEIERRDAGDDAKLHAYEKALLEALTPEDGQRLKVSEITCVAPAIPRVQSLLYDEMVEQGWYERRPDAVRSSWGTIANGAVIAGIIGTALLVAFTPFALAGLAFLAVALGLVYVANEMPARTAAGARLMQGLAVLSSDLRSHDTDQMPEGREYRELSAVLPYAVVLGGRERWLAALVRADDDDDADPTDLDWYHAPEDWHLRDLPDSLRNLVIHLEGELFSR